MKGYNAVADDLAATTNRDIISIGIDRRIMKLMAVLLVVFIGQFPSMPAMAFDNAVRVVDGPKMRGTDPRDIGKSSIVGSPNDQL